MMRHGECIRLREDVGLALVYDDQTPFGSGVTGLCDALLRRTCAVLEPVVAREGPQVLQARAAEWMARIMGPRALGRLYAGPERLREECLYPPAASVRAVALDVSVPGAGAPRAVRMRLGDGERGELAAWLGEWQRGAVRPRATAAAGLWDRLQDAGAFERPQPPRQPLADGVTLVGHATVAVRSGGTQLVFDPFLLPPCADDPPSWRPHTPCDLEPSAIFVTHSHPDHFDVATLLRLGRDVPIYVPEVPRESLLSIDMALRLRELGFTAVRTLRWGSEVRIGPFRVHALPFFGEQPTDGRMLHPEARNLGNTYVVEGAGQRLALVADAGRDEAGDTIAMAASARAQHGPVDAVFGGYRAWRIQPIRYLFSSVARYLLFVPPDQRTRWQQIMNDADDLVATGAAWGARAVVPYANGGAPWFARIELGPHGTPERPDDPCVDPSLEEVERAVARSDARLELHALRAGQHVPPGRWRSPVRGGAAGSTRGGATARGASSHG